MTQEMPKVYFYQGAYLYVKVTAIPKQCGLAPLNLASRTMLNKLTGVERVMCLWLLPHWQDTNMSVWAYRGFAA